jgi:hypothetical protein
MTDYLKIISHYENCLEKHGDTHLGVDWPKADEALTRYKIMLELIKPGAEKVNLLDFGCGASHLYEFIINNKITNISYNGLDISEKFINLSKTKFPENKYYCTDILKQELDLPDFDYIIMNGVFTEKRELTFTEMFDYFKLIIKKIFSKADKGIAFNVMSKQVDWERDDLFHLPLDTLAFFLTGEITRKFIIRNDYGLYDYTVYVYK